MDREAYNALLAQYATQEVSVNGQVSWDGGVRCVMPEVRLYGKCQQDGTPTLDTPVEIRCNNGVFVARGSNLVDMPDIVSQKYSVDVKSYIQWYIDLPVGTTITVSADAYTPQGARGRASAWRIVLKDKTMIELWTGYTNAEKRVSYTHTKTVDFSISDVSYSLWYLGYGVGEYDRWAKNITVNIGSNDLGYSPYYDGGQATAPELYAIPGTEYRDEWDAQTGKGVRRCGKYAFTGTEDFGISGGYSTPDYNAYYAFGAVPNVLKSVNHQGFCTHLTRKASTYGNEIGVIFGANNTQIYFSVPKDIYPDVASWKSFLAEQYAAGTPVTLVYALNTPETFTATPARLTMPPGAGQIIQVGGDVADCPISAKFLTHS